MLTVTHVLPFGAAEARRAALEQAGTPIVPYDALIAATALARQAALVTHNVAEFSRAEGLQVVDWYV